jgi:hypothetical protein
MHLKPLTAPDEPPEVHVIGERTRTNNELGALVKAPAPSCIPWSATDNHIND